MRTTFATAVIAATVSAHIDAKAPFEFLGGFLEGMIGDNHLDEVYTCEADAEVILTNADKAFKKLENHDFEGAITYFYEIAGALEITVSDCIDIGDDIQAIKEWSKIFDDKTKLIENITTHMLIHRKQVEDDIHAAKADWSAANYYKAGEDAADLVTIALGPIEQGDKDRFAYLL